MRERLGAGCVVGALVLAAATACPRVEPGRSPKLPDRPEPSEPRRPSTLERCLDVAGSARALGRVDIMADALGAAAQLERTEARRLEWARGLVQIDPRRAQGVARPLADSRDAAIRASVADLMNATLAAPHPLAPGFVDRVLAARLSGGNDAVLRELLPHVDSLPVDMLHRLASAYQSGGDERAATRVWARVRHTRNDLGGGWSLVQGGPFAIGSVSAGPDGLTLMTSGPGPLRGDLAHVQLPDGGVWSLWWSAGLGGHAWLGPTRRVLGWSHGRIEVRDADSGGTIAERMLPPSEDILQVATVPGVAVAALVRDGAIELVDASLVARSVHPFATEDVTAVALAPSGQRLALFDRAGGVRVFDVETGQTRSLAPLAAAPKQAVWRSDDRIVALGEDGGVRWIGARRGGAWSKRPFVGGVDGRVLAAAVAPTGTHAAVVDPRGIVVFDVSGGMVRRHEHTWHGEHIHLDFSPDGGEVVIVDAAAVTRLSMPALTVVSQWLLAGTRFDAERRDDSATCLALDLGGRHLYTTRPGARLVVWDLAAASTPPARFGWPRSSARPIADEQVFALSEHGSSFALSRRGASAIDLVRDGSVVTTIALGDPPPGVLAMAVNDGAVTVAVATDEGLALYGAPLPRRLAGGPVRPRRMAFADGGRLLQVQDGSGQLAIWEVASGTKLGVYGPADELGVVDLAAAQIAYWRGPTLYVAPLAGGSTQPREYVPCGPGCRLQAVVFIRNGGGIEWLADDGRTELTAAIDLHTGAAAPLAAGASRLAGASMVRRRPSGDALVIRRGDTATGLTIAVAADLKEWAATTPEAILDGSFTRPWSFALRADDGALYDIEPFMLTTRAAGMVPEMLTSSVPPACMVVP